MQPTPTRDVQDYCDDGDVSGTTCIISELSASDRLRRSRENQIYKNCYCKIK